MALTVPTVAADNSAVAEIDGARSANGELLRTIEGNLKDERSRLEKLTELQTLGHASWREVAEQRASVESLAAAYSAAQDFDGFAASLMAFASQSTDQTSANAETSPPTTILADGRLVSCLLELGAKRRDWVTVYESAQARLSFVDELLRRMQLVKERGFSREAVELTQMDREYYEAVRLVSSDELRHLALQEADLVEGREVVVPPCGWLLPSLAPRPFGPWGEGARAVFQPVMSATNIPISRTTCSAVSIFAPSATQASFVPQTSSNIPTVFRCFSEPSYADYYMFGNRRPDLPPQARNAFFNGNLRWYLPGSTTNFK